MKDAAYYTLIVTSSNFHENSITFEIVVKSNEVDQPASNSLNSIPLVAFVLTVVILVMIIVLLTVVIIVICKQKINRESKNNIILLSKGIKRT